MSQNDITPEMIPYVVNPDGTVKGELRTYRARGGGAMQIFIPEPKGPDDGWKPGQRETFMNNLLNTSIPGIRSAIKRFYGTTSFRLESVEPFDAPFELAAETYRSMMEGKE